MKLANMLAGIAFATTLAAAPVQASVVYSYSTLGCFADCGIGTNFVSSAHDNGGNDTAGINFSGTTTVKYVEVGYQPWTIDASE